MEKKGMQGFTLIELMVVVALLGILATFAHASFREVAGRAKLNGAIEMIGADIRKSRYESIMSGEHHQIDFNPAEGSYLIDEHDKVLLPQGVRFGADQDVTGKPNQAGDLPPADGVTFKGEGVENRAEFYPKGLVIPTGAVYVTNGDETMAITLYLNGHVRMWRSEGGNKWTLL